MDLSKINLDAQWMQYLTAEFQSPYMQNLTQFLAKERAHKTIFPPKGDTFSALNLCPPEKVKVVIIGQDPYHGVDQAHGLCFSVRPGVKPPPSLKNIYKELHQDIGMEIPSHGFLQSWAEQGVLMLNAVLTVEAGKAASHQGKGWEQFTDAIVDILNDHYEHIVFMLWGNYARKKGEKIDRSHHLVLESAHPSPFSATRFFGNKHFSRANQYLAKHGLRPIEWTLPLHVH